MDPLFFTPVYKDYLWGGTRISEVFHRDLPPGIYAESWELSDHPDGMSRVTDGPFKGMTLKEVIHKDKQALFGKHPISTFPLLLKIIDAHENLSIQVHPSDQTAAVVRGEAKTEAWIILEATADAAVYAGFKEAYSRETIDDALGSKQIVDMMQKLSVKKGDVVSIPGGRLHAIGKGCLILEIQQHSNTTYRVYDWDRKDAEGHPRALHLEKARQVLRYGDHESPLIKPKHLKKTKEESHWHLLTTSHFKIEKRELKTSFMWPHDASSFEVLFINEGEGVIKWEDKTHRLKKGMTCLFPACMPPTTIDVHHALEIYIFTLP